MTVWVHRGCHCCGGIEWGGESPVECNDCDAWVSENDRTAAWPGGPFSGSQPGAFKEECERVGVAMVTEPRTMASVAPFVKDALSAFAEFPKAFEKVSLLDRPKGRQR